MNFSRKISHHSLMIFYDQFATLIGNNISIKDTIATIIKEKTNRNLHRELSKIQTEIMKGMPALQALKCSPQIFPLPITELMEMKLSQAQMADLFKCLTTESNNIYETEKQFHKALLYPATITGFALLIGGLMLLFVLPVFKLMFEGYGALPYATSLVIRLGENGGVTLWASLFFFIMIAVSLKRHKSLQLYIPFWSSIVRRYNIIRFCRYLRVMLNTKMDIHLALNNAALLMDKAALAKQLSTIVQNPADKTKSLSSLMATSSLFTPLTLQMITVGEKVDNVEESLDKLSVYLQDDADRAMGYFFNIINPLVMIFPAGLVLLMLLAMYLPIFQMAS